MTKKLFSTILTTCLFFGSLYLPAHAETVKKTLPPTAKLQQKKSPEANFLDGNTCLKQAKTDCARLALANIPSTSPYAKLLQGSLALTEKQTDKALLLLLPLQAEENLIPEAKISLHQFLASAFEKLDDTQQAVQHLMLAETVMTTSTLPDTQDRINEGQQRIWGLINKLEQTELIELRGNNTDNNFQGWIDLCLAARNQDLSSSLASWSSSYADHPAQAFSKKLSPGKTTPSTMQTSLTSEGSVALIMPIASEADSAKAEAFQQGLQTAMLKYELHNAIKIYTSAANKQDTDEIYTLAKNEGNAYFIIPDFSIHAAGNRIDQTNTNSILHVSLAINDEVQDIVSFISSHGMRHITVISNDNEASKLMLSSFQEAWRNADAAPLNIVTLPGDLTSAGGSLLELKSQIAAINHDMVLLAMSAADARAVRPHLDISTPTMAFSSANEITRESTSQPLNAVRFVDIPFLLMSGQDKYKDYLAASSNLNSNELSRWFALGVDSLQLLILGQQPLTHEALINGLSGTLSIDKTGNLKRRLSLARFTHNGVESEQ